MGKLQSNSRHWRYTLSLPEAVAREAVRQGNLEKRVAKRKAVREKRLTISIERLESGEQKLLLLECKRRGWFVWKLTAPGRRGWPDMFVADPVSKRCAFIEMKSKDRRSVATIAQINTVKALTDSGQNAYIATGYRDAMTFLLGVFK